MTGRYIAEVEANSIVEAKKLAEEEYEYADFGELQDVGEYGLKYSTTEDENGNLLDG